MPYIAFAFPNCKQQIIYVITNCFFLNLVYLEISEGEIEALHLCTSRAKQIGFYHNPFSIALTQTTLG